MEPASVISTAASAWRAAEALKLQERLADFFRARETIVVLGLSGTGKTNLLSFLASGAVISPPIDSDDRSENVERHKVRINKRPFFVFDTPGQTAYSADRRELLRERVSSDTSGVRIINVVSYGYHEYGAGRAEAFTRSGRVSEVFLKKHRQSEIDAVNEWVQLVGDRSSVKWILTVVTKADLWWSDKDLVLEHYSSGPYHDLIKHYDQRIKHVVKPVCSVVHRFFDEAPVSGSFDDSIRSRLADAFITTVGSMR